MIKEITFEQITPVWSEKLWPGRSNFETHSAMLLGKDHQYRYDMTNMHLPVFYFGLMVDDTLKGVNSAHLCGDGSMRSRGLWVDKDVRGQGYGSSLLNAAVHRAVELNCSFIWSYPRKTSWPTYRSVGFMLTSDWSRSETSPENAFCRLDIE